MEDLAALLAPQAPSDPATSTKEATFVTHRPSLGLAVICYRDLLEAGASGGKLSAEVTKPTAATLGSFGARKTAEEILERLCLQPIRRLAAEENISAPGVVPPRDPWASSNIF